MSYRSATSSFLIAVSTIAIIVQVSFASHHQEDETTNNPLDNAKQHVVNLIELKNLMSQLEREYKSVVSKANTAHGNRQSIMNNMNKNKGKTPQMLVNEAQHAYDEAVKTRKAAKGVKKIARALKNEAVKFSTLQYRKNIALRAQNRLMKDTDSQAVNNAADAFRSTLNAVPQSIENMKTLLETTSSIVKGLKKEDDAQHQALKRDIKTKEKEKENVVDTTESLPSTIHSIVASNDEAVDE